MNPLSTILVALMFISCASHSALISDAINGDDVVVDDQQQLIWLNWEDTYGISRYDMESNLLNGVYAQWRYASFNEMTILIDQLFPTLPLVNMGLVDGLQNADYFDIANGHQVLTDNLSSFDALFGSVRADASSASASAYFGDANYGLIGGGLSYDASQAIVIMDGFISDPSFEDRVSLFTTGLDGNLFSHALVRSIPVSSPNTIAILLCGLLCVVGLQRLKR